MPNLRRSPSALAVQVLCNPLQSPTPSRAPCLRPLPEWYRPLALASLPLEHQPNYQPAAPVFLPAGLRPDLVSLKPSPDFPDKFELTETYFLPASRVGKTAWIGVDWGKEVAQACSLPPEFLQERPEMTVDGMRLLMQSWERTSLLAIQTQVPPVPLLPQD